GDPVNPCFQIGVAPKALDTLKSAQESLLRQIARFFSVFRQAIEQAVNFAGTLRDQPVECFRLARLQSFNEPFLARGADFAVGSRSNLLQLQMPAQRNWLSVAHSLSPGAGQL